ncbi:phosphatase PAP2 family protein, partial [Streptomyces cyaneofuscatus]
PPGAVGGGARPPAAPGVQTHPPRGTGAPPPPTTPHHEGLEVLIHGKTDYSFVSDHSTLAMALAVGIFVANRKFGFVALGLAVFAGVSRVYMGVHYPTDVIGGFALGTAVALLLAPLAMALLTPLMAAVSRSDRVGWIVRSKKADAADAAYAEERGDTHGIPEPRPGSGRGHPGEKDLAA